MKKMGNVKMTKNERWTCLMREIPHTCVFCMHSYMYALTYVSLTNYFRGAHSFVSFVVCFKNKKLFSLYLDVFNM